MGFLMQLNLQLDDSVIDLIVTLEPTKDPHGAK